jgi:hypothetical protein
MSNEMSKCKIQRIVIEVDKGESIWDASRYAASMSILHRTDVEFVFNGTVYDVKIQDLIEQVQPRKR